MTRPHANPIPNILTGIRLFAGVIMFLILAGATGIPVLSSYLSPDDQFALYRAAFWIFVIAASTDWVDGYLARRWNSTTRWGAILDPIADKTLQMVALGAQQLILLWDGFGFPLDWQPHFQTFAYVLIWAAAVVTLWTGWQYFDTAKKQMSEL